MQRASLLIALAAALVLTTTGCVSAHRTIVNDPDRIAVNFASERAGRVFYEALSRMPDLGSREENRSSVSLILINVGSRIITGPSAKFNAAVAMADSDRNGMITEQEADIFASTANLARLD